MRTNLILNNLKKLDYYDKINFLFKQNFIGKLIKKGKKRYALNNYYKFKQLIKEKSKKDANLMFFLVFYRSIIKFHFIKKRFGGTKKEIPMFLNKKRQLKFILKKMLNNSKYVEKRKSIDLLKLTSLYLNTLKKKSFLITDKRKALLKARENKILVRSLKR
jgi:ribosomal protein S7